MRRRYRQPRWLPFAATARNCAVDAGVTVASPYIEVVEPWTLILAGRLFVLLMSVATVLLVGLLGMRIAGRTAGILAACCWSRCCPSS